MPPRHFLMVFVDCGRRRLQPTSAAAHELRQSVCVKLSFTIFMLSEAMVAILNALFKSQECVSVCGCVYVHRTLLGFSGNTNGVSKYLTGKFRLLSRPELSALN